MGIIDSQSVRTTEAGGQRGDDASTRIRGRKPDIATETAGNLLDALVHSADIQDRDGAFGLIEIVKRSNAGRFVFVPRRWLVERAIAWGNRCRRLTNDWEEAVASAEAWLAIASIKRDYVRVSSLPDALTALTSLAGWIEDYNDNRPHSGLKTRSPREHRALVSATT